MKRGLIYTIPVLLAMYLFIFLSGKRRVGGKFTLYSYTSEGIGYSDIEKLYKYDSSKRGVSFFQSPALQKTRFSFSCQLQKTMMNKKKASRVDAYQIFSPVIAIESDGMPVNSDIIREELSRPFFVESLASGKIVNLRMDTTLSTISVNIVKGILSQLQFVITTGEKKEWQSIEENPLGTYMAKYAFIKDSADISQYQKAHVKYLQLTSTNKNQSISAESISSFFITRGGNIQKLSCSEAQYVLFGTDTISASGNQSDLDVIGEGINTAKDFRMLAHMEDNTDHYLSTTLSSGLSEDQVNRLAYTNTLGQNNWENLLQKLDTTTGNDIKQKEQLVLEFRALAYLFPANCKKMEDILMTEPLNSFRLQVLAEALAQTQTSISLNTLVAVIGKRRKEEMLVIELLPSLALSSTPTENAVALTRSLAFDETETEAVRSTAQLTLAAISYNFRKTNEGRSRELTQFLLDKMSSEKDTLQKILVLGNTGSPAVISELKTLIFTDHASTQVRTYAINGLRLIDSGEVQSLLDKLGTAGDSVIQKTAQEVRAFRKEYFN